MTANSAAALLDNLFWHALAGDQARLGLGTDEVRRYAPGFPPIVAFADPRRPRLDQLATLVARNEPVYCDGWAAVAPPGWRVELEARMIKMIWRGPMPDEDPAPQAVRLGPAHVPQATALAELTRPGPFGPRNLEMGEYFGLFDEPGDQAGAPARLLAMAGERCAAGPLREVSAVCTQPDMQGRGLARRLMLKLVARQMARGETPVLHVMSHNEGALGLYRRMGFEDHLETVVRVIARD
ncbi:GNAT family N-acetyltransferase [Variovorax sp.]|uniref:GNAT family N-acetyltransferase n=1 Tax=Variovorax sp. TaxID=1871043 RepID=UPI002D5FBB70|nr:GNAT family N-acetyltransferase [Variovorax sp.]HYP83461.1 GNAT family N-acetyltransferase [Variovorax sp.]